MKRIALALLAVPFMQAATAQGLEPGEWEFAATVTSPDMPKPQSMTMKRCVTPEEARSPEKWMAQPGQQSDCKADIRNAQGGVMNLQLSCPKSGVTGTGTAKVGPGTMESRLTMRANMAGKSLEMLTTMQGRRLGPCKK